jgi:predicted DNA-binding ribbon-helix-helix protein
VVNNDDPLDREIDFSKGVRSKFYRPGMKLRIPIYLEETLLGSLAEIAERRGMNVDDLVSDLLRRDLAIVDALR